VSTQPPSGATPEPIEPTEASKAVAWSARGNTRWIVVRGPRGRAFDRWLVRRLGVSVITWQYAKAGGQRYKPTLLLTTIGRRSGALRPRALPYTRVGDAFVVVGSNGGGPKDPDWVWNVRADSTAWVHVNRREIPVRAHVAEGAEHDELFARLSEASDSLARYQERAATFGRTVPLVVLEPRS
jgi:deazaflavin-dependent oxidoreductase (nitroreductase family)